MLSCTGDRFAAAAEAAAATAASTTSFCCLDKAEACGTAVRFLEDGQLFLAGTLQVDLYHEALDPSSSGPWEPFLWKTHMVRT